MRGQPQPHGPAHGTCCSYVRLGRWHDAVTSSQDAVRADAEDARLCHAPYDPEHNAQMLVYAANMAGQVAPCLALALAGQLLPLCEAGHAYVAGSHKPSS